MASIVFPAGWRLTDSNNNAVNNGKIYVYDAGTTNEASVYSDKALSTALTQPIRTNAGGIPITSGNAETLIYVASSADYKVEAKTSADAQIWGPIDDYPILGRNSGTVAVAEGGTGSTTAAAARTALGAAAQSDYTTLSTDVTTITGERAALPGASFGDAAGLDDVTPSYMDGLDDLCVQKHYETSSATTVLSTAVPADSTAPASSEGHEIFSHTFTPQYSASTIEIEAAIPVQFNATAVVTAAIFIGGANAVAVDGSDGQTGTNNQRTLRPRYRYAPGSTSAITISVRAGPSSGSATLNTPTYGGVNVAQFRIRELVDPPVT